MAQVNFDNAIITPYTSNPASASHLALYRGDQAYYKCVDINGNSVVSSRTMTLVSESTSGFEVLFTGTFSTSGSEFYIKIYYMNAFYWRISNISFASGDTFNFKIKANLTCN